MDDLREGKRYRFGVFEMDTAAGELRRQGLRVKLNAQPFQILTILLERAGEVVSREEIVRQVWPEGTFVDYEHGVNSAMNRIREALGDRASSPRYVETLARKGYRFVAPVERVGEGSDSSSAVSASSSETENVMRSLLATEEELPEAAHGTVKTLFLLLQGMYLAFYVGALANLGEIGEILEPLRVAGAVMSLLVVSAAVLIPVRAFLVSGVLFRAPGFREKYLRMWVWLLFADVAWALSPFLLLHHINIGLALGCTALLVYAPFAQRSLMLMGASGGEA